MHSTNRMYLLVPILLLFVVGVGLTLLLPGVDDGGLGVLRRASLSQPRGSLSDSFTIIMQTYNRTDLLLKLLNHYQAVPHLHRIIIVWNSVGEKVPQELWDSLGPHPVPVVFKEQAVNLMRNRLQRFPEQETEAVLMLDDDTLISAPDISFAFSVWKQFPNQIVGFVPRKHVLTPSGVYSYGSFELQDPEAGSGDRYSMVLVGAAFFHQSYLNAFQRQPAEVLRLIDETQNCDDIAMNFVVSQLIQKPAGVFVKPVDVRNLERDASSGYLGMWHRAEHLLQRSFCLNRLVQIYSGMPLRYSNLMISQFGFPSYANHKDRH
ncbi:EXTL2 protein, partial [Atractosteus spatula]|nr:EXTL2 protein [Atractosteus spatula]